MAMITDVEDFFTKGCGRCDKFATPGCVTRIWTKGLDELRAICLDMGLSEHVKWGHPCYMHAGRNIALIGALRSEIRFSFFNAALLRDPEGVLELGGPNTRNASIIRITDTAQVAKLEPVIRAYLSELMGYAEAGVKPPKVVEELELPDELVEALDSDPELAEGFWALTPGRQKSYVINLNGAKKVETRFARIEKFRRKILAGKGAMER